MIKAWSTRRISASRLVNMYFQVLMLNSTFVARRRSVHVLILKLNMTRQESRLLGEGTSGLRVCSTQGPGSAVSSL